jgi:hypothetical protein
MIVVVASSQLIDSDRCTATQINSNFPSQSDFSSHQNELFAIQKHRKWGTRRKSNQLEVIWPWVAIRRYRNFYIVASWLGERETKQKLAWLKRRQNSNLMNIFRFSHVFNRLWVELLWFLAAARNCGCKSDVNYFCIPPQSIDNE